MTSKQWQLANDAAQRYEDILVPAILGPFAKSLVDYADLTDAAHVVDIGCGTGAATRYAAQKMKPSSTVMGIDVNTSMLAVAESLPEVEGASITWQQDNAYELSLDDASTDAVLCAQTLQFMTEKTKALNEMHRILKSGQALYFSLWCEIEHSPYFDALVNAVAKHINPDTAAGLGSAFNLSKLDDIMQIMEESNFSEVKTDTVELQLPLPSMPEFVPRHIGATPMGKGFQASSKDTQQAIIDELTEGLADYQTETGTTIPFASHLITARK